MKDCVVIEVSLFRRLGGGKKSIWQKVGGEGEGRKKKDSQGR